ncbi:unnamed protein product [Meganyctiphanes norvegica]|uniref:Uncharacterized protein n=4 Tax=Meganyctiphanes norvegica TaxID=48144 RepID=A0AAV2S153_MEGNR
MSDPTLHHTPPNSDSVNTKEVDTSMVDIFHLLRDILSKMKGLDKLDNIAKDLDKLDNIAVEVRSVRDDMQTFRGELQGMRDKIYTLENAVEELKQIPNRKNQFEEAIDKTISDMLSTLEYHQKYIETVERQTNNKNIIITGVPEFGNILGSDDVERVMHVIKKTGFEETDEKLNIHMKRLGKIRDDLDDRPRPLLVEVESDEIQKEILMKARNLMYDDDCSNIFIKKDVHFTVRRELNRLKRREIDENENPMNVGFVFKFDWKDRVLRKNGTIIDRFNPSF